MMKKVLQFRSNNDADLEIRVDSPDSRAFPIRIVHYGILSLATRLKSHYDHAKAKSIARGVGAYLALLDEREQLGFLDLSERIKAMPPARYRQFMEEVLQQSRFAYGARLGEIYFEVGRKYVVEPHLRVIAGKK